MTELRSERYSVSCTSAGCRWARLHVPTLEGAEELARQHAHGGHVVEVFRESTHLVARYGVAGVCVLEGSRR
jgi:hypothetical protein